MISTVSIFTIGHASIDLVETPRGRRKQPGGAAVYSAISASAFMKTGIVSRIGTDYPREFLNLLSSAGIDIGGMIRTRGRSSHFSISYDNSYNASYGDYGIEVGRYLNPNDIPRRYLRKARGVHISPMNPKKQSRFVEFLRESFDGVITLNTHEAYISRYRRILLDLAGKVDFFILNEREANLLTRSKRIDRAIEYFRRIDEARFVVTLGSLGSCVVLNGEMKFAPSLYNGDIVDPTGAGDSFCGAFLASYLMEEDPILSATAGNCLASLKAEGWNFESLLGLRFKDIKDLWHYVITKRVIASGNQRRLDEFL